jgi:hypothetical protein
MTIYKLSCLKCKHKFYNKVIKNAKPVACTIKVL